MSNGSTVAWSRSMLANWSTCSKFKFMSFCELFEFPVFHGPLFCVHSRSSSKFDLCYKNFFKFALNCCFGNFFLNIVSVLKIFLFEIFGICVIIDSTKVSSMTPDAAPSLLCFPLSFKKLGSNSIFLTYRITVVLCLRFFLLGGA